MVPKVDVRLVIIGTIISISLFQVSYSNYLYLQNNSFFQYFSAKQKYSEAIDYACTVGKYRNLAINKGVERGVSFVSIIKRLLLSRF